MANEITAPWADAKANLQTTVLGLTRQTHDAEIKTEADAEKVTDMIKLCTSLLTKIDAQRKEYTAPINAIVAGINDDAKALGGPLLAAKVRLQGMLTPWLMAKKREAVEAARIEREKNDTAKLEKAAMLEDAGFKDDADEVLNQTTRGTGIAARTVRASQTRGDFGGTASIKTTWKWEVVDMQKVPIAFLEVASPTVTAFMRATNEAIENEAMERSLRGKERESFIDAEREKRYMVAGLRFWKEESANVR
jgi:hypothetical protein